MESAVFFRIIQKNERSNVDKTLEEGEEGESKGTFTYDLHKKFSMS